MCASSYETPGIQELLAEDQTASQRTPEKLRKFYAEAKDKLIAQEIPIPQIAQIVTEIVTYEKDKNNRGTTRKERKRDQTFYRVMMERLIVGKITTLSDETAKDICTHNLEGRHRGDTKAIRREIRMLEQIELDRKALEECRKTDPSTIHAHGLDMSKVRVVTPEEREAIWQEIQRLEREEQEEVDNLNLSSSEGLTGSLFDFDF